MVPSGSDPLGAGLPVRDVLGVAPVTREAAGRRRTGSVFGPGSKRHGPAGGNPHGKGMLMSGKVFKKTEITRTSTVSSDDAIQNAIARANRTVRNMRWFEVVEQRGAIGEGEVAEWQVTLKIGFALED